jgi:hypothetical protein
MVKREPLMRQQIAKASVPESMIGSNKRLRINFLSTEAWVVFAQERSLVFFTKPMKTVFDTSSVCGHMEPSDPLSKKERKE